MSRIKDRTNTITSTGVKVISFAEIKNKEAHWNCECPICHQHWIVKGSRLNEPKPISMCKTCSAKNNLKKIKQPFFKDLTGQRFGKLIALEKTNKKNKTYFWKCKCDCGNFCEKEVQYLLNGDVQSCGCLVSEGEKKIIKILKENNINFKKEVILFKKYRFDFLINDTYIIEFDGIQHFKQRINRESLEKIHQRDIEKNQYCFKNNIPIIRIPYLKDNIFLKDLLLETSKYVLTKENENEYYRIN